MKHEDPSLYPFKSSAFPPVCPTAEEPADGTDRAETGLHAATASGFLSSGLTPGEHKPGITPPFQGIAIHGTEKSALNNILSKPYNVSDPNRALGANGTPSASSESIPSRELSFRSALSTHEDRHASARGVGTPPETCRNFNFVEQHGDALGAAAPENVGEQRLSDSFTHSRLRCRSSGDSHSPVSNERKAENVPDTGCAAHEPRDEKSHATDCQIWGRTVLQVTDASEARHTRGRRAMRRHAEGAGEEDSEGLQTGRERHEKQDHGHSRSSVERKHAAIPTSGHTPTRRRHEQHADDDKRQSKSKDIIYKRSSQGEEREGRAQERTDATRKRAEHAREDVDRASNQKVDSAKEPHLVRAAAREHDEVAGAEESGSEGNRNEEDNASAGVGKWKGNDAAREHEERTNPSAPQEADELKRNDKGPPYQQIKACSCLAYDLSCNYPSSSSSSDSCIDASREGNVASAREKIRFALAGRSMAKLRKLRHQLAERLGTHCMHIHLLAANPADEEALTKLCSRARVVLSTCGPYRLCGEPIVKACVSARTHYCDVTAEVSYVAAMAAKYGSAAEEKKLKLLFFCGAASLPSDIAVLLTQREALRRRGTPCHEIRTAVTDCFGGFSGGSVMGLGHVFEEGAVFDPFFLVKYASRCPPSKEDLLPYIRPQLFLAKHDEDFGYCAYNFLAPLNENVVRFSAVLLGLYARRESQREAASSPNASEAGEKADMVEAFAAEHGRKEGNRSLMSYFPWRGTSAPSPASADSPLISSLVCAVSHSKPSASYSSTSNCTPSVSCKFSPASTSPRFPSPLSLTASPTSSPRRRNCSLPFHAAPHPFTASHTMPSSVMPPAPLLASNASALQRMCRRPRSADIPAAPSVAAEPAVAPVPPSICRPAGTPAGAAQGTASGRSLSALAILSFPRIGFAFFRYSECVALGYDMLTASIVSLVTFVLMFLVTSSFFRAALTALHVFPRPGEGPPRQFLYKGHFQIKTVGRVYPSSRFPDNVATACCHPVDDDEEEAENEQERRFYKPPHCHDRETVITATMGSASGDPGYKETGKMLVETGLSIALHLEDCFEVCGVCTPASGVGFVLVDRLRKAGMKFEVKVKQF